MRLLNLFIVEESVGSKAYDWGEREVSLSGIPGLIFYPPQTVREVKSIEARLQEEIDGSVLYRRNQIKQLQDVRE